MNKLLLRSISGLIYVALIIGTLLCGTVYFCALCMVFAAVGIVEYHKLTDAHGHASYTAIGVDLFGILILTSVPLWYLVPGSTLASQSLMGLIFLAVYTLIRMLAGIYDKRQDATRSVAYSFMGVAYIGFGLIAAECLSLISPMLVLLLFIFIWINDTGAFLVGSKFGHRRLFERLSPKKSWEGFAGGLILVLAVSIALGYKGVTLRMLGMQLYYGSGPYQIVYLLPVVTVIFATLGDLFESMLKRSVGAKDSGNIIPGHGGLLDRIDSMLFVMPAAALSIMALIIL